MKNFNSIMQFSAVCLIMLFSISASAQLSGTYTIGGTSPDYATLSAAVSDLNSSGVNGAVVFNIRDGNYSGSSWQGQIGNVTGASASNTITFQSQSGNRTNCVLSPSGSSSSNYVFYLNGCKYVTIKDLTLNNTSSSYGCDIRIGTSTSNNTVQNCVLTGHTGSSTSSNKARIYGSGLASSPDNKFYNNLFERGSMAFYLYGNGTTSVGSGYVFEDNEFNENYNEWGYGYYMGDITFKGNTFNRSGSASTYFYGLRLYYTGNGLNAENNTFNNSCNAYYNYTTYLYFSNYYTQNKDYYPYFTGNVFNISTGSSTYYNYAAYNVYTTFGKFENNTYNIASTYTSGYIYNYFMYYGYNCRAEGNTWNYSKPGGTVYSMLMYYGGTDTVKNNNINMTGNATFYGYAPYYSQGYHFVDNTIDVDKSSGTAYNYCYGYSGTYAGNNISLRTGSGTIYGLYLGQSQGGKVYNNVIRVKSTSTCYGLYGYYNYSGTKFFNNTIYNEGTSSNAHAAYIYNYTSSYDMELKNNIFYKTSSNGYALYTVNANYFKSDYNVFYKPSGNYFYSSNQGGASSNLTQWRTKAKDDMNSLIYDVPFVNASAGDFEIDPTSPNAWAVNGRAEHDTTAITDIAGNTRPKFVTDGVPDLGAYEVTPTSTPPVADASPSAPVANSTQVFTFGEDTVATIDWGSTVPTSYDVRQYTGVQAGPMPTGVGRMYFYAAGTASDYEHSHTPHVYYKDPWIGDVPSEQEAVIARSTNGGAWEGYNYSNASTDAKRNILSPAFALDSVGSYTGVQEGRIGIRCVEAPKGVIISNILKDGADITWDPVFNPIGYQVIVNTSSAMPSDADWNNPANFVGTNTKTFVNLAEDTKFYVHIRSICGVKDTSGRTLDSFVTLIDCHVPDIKISGLSDTRAIAYWGDIKTSYKYEYVVSTSATTPAFGTDITQTSVQAPFLDADKQYYVHVKAHCSSIYPESGWGVAAFKTFPLGVSNVGTEGNGVEVYPNPAGEQLNVLIGGNLGTDGKVMVTDVTGKVLQVSEVTGNTISVNVSGLASGVYMLQYTDDVRRETVKFNKK